ncbi:hypothetical protein JF66_15180 [Cryobacterium sp. MLB-32]|uniref:hypothetical protein n=1 Tax=Cryobacterium sp. MLB-32 TaxID=1529318 RepID=UPI0004E69780|nr:hypothetical protein [Cryobacterium sp. MLB-32]KFF58887.1 hypothetical protein JF66_15180 [Cryobacterium sp. MLB-32]
MTMAETMNALMIVAAAVNACCVVGSRRSRSFHTLVSAGLMAGAMLDTATHVLGVPPLLWAVILVGWGILGAALHRMRDGRLAAPMGVPSTVHLHHGLGLIVTAAQLMAHSQHTAAGPLGAVGGHAHASSLLIPLALAAGAVFVVYSATLVATGSRTRLERGNFLSMCAMTVSMGIMPFV